MGKDNYTTWRCTRARTNIAHRILIAAGCIALVTAAHAAEPMPTPTPIEERALFDELFAQPGEQASRGAAQRVEREQALNFFKSKAWDDVVVSGFIASRRPQAANAGPATDMSATAADYRTYVGLQYDHGLSDEVRVSTHTFYGAGTYDGDNSYVNPDGGALPDEVRRSGEPVGQWLGSDWKVSSRMLDRHSFQAGVEYRQKVAAQLFAPDAAFGTHAPVAEPGPARKIGMLANTRLALARDVSLSAGVRYDAAREANRVRNYEVGYEQPLTSRDRLRFTAYRYDANGIAASAASSVEGPALAAETAARIDATGVEVGLDHHRPSGARASVSYSRHHTRDALAASNPSAVERRSATVNVGIPVLTNRLSTGIEFQYHDVAAPLLDATPRDFVIGNIMVASGELASDTKVSIGVQNVFGVRDEMIGAQPLPFAPQDGRTLRVELSRRF